MLHNFILNASNDSKQAGVSGPWQLIKENNSGMALIGEHFPLAPFLEAAFIYRPQRQEIKAGVFSVIGHFVLFTYRRGLGRLTLPVIAENNFFEPDDSRDELFCPSLHSFSFSRFFCCFICSAVFRARGGG